MAAIALVLVVGDQRSPSSVTVHSDSISPYGISVYIMHNQKQWPKTF